MTDEEKVQSYLATKGATPCPPMLAEDAHRQAGAISRGGREPKGMHPSYCMMPERRLAHAVISTALNDLGGRFLGASAGERLKLSNEAEGWFRNRRDFELWCEIAGFDPDYVRGKAREVLERGLPPVKGPRTYARGAP